MAIRPKDTGVTGIHHVRNPQKPTHVATETSPTLR